MKSAAIGIVAGGVFGVLFFLERDAYIPLSGITALALFGAGIILAAALSISRPRRRGAVLLLVSTVTFYATFFAATSAIALRYR